MLTGGHSLIVVRCSAVLDGGEAPGGPASPEQQTSRIPTGHKVASAATSAVSGVLFAQNMMNMISASGPIVADPALHGEGAEFAELGR